ncbi:hypothetical protein CVT24_007570 [Panaeolus cyanescens]|uniref:Uncharacterized protein n=1 Tax=Panaeolus cyanescens TaxID=181874 RepID=A0A409YKM6_9AGAR|nr:hypothetical protein CVT24_007570 [Panaeolus cyanescens]
MATVQPSERSSLSTWIDCSPLQLRLSSRMQPYQATVETATTIWFISLLLCGILYGGGLMQTWRYSRWNKEDHWVIRGMVIVLTMPTDQRPLYKYMVANASIRGGYLTVPTRYSMVFKYARIGQNYKNTDNAPEQTQLGLSYLVVLIVQIYFSLHIYYRMYYPGANMRRGSLILPAMILFLAPYILSHVLSRSKYEKGKFDFARNDLMNSPQKATNGPASAVDLFMVYFVDQGGLNAIVSAANLLMASTKAAITNCY